MKTKKILALLSSFFIFSYAVAVEDTGFPGLDWHGFDWADWHLENKKCVPMTKKLLARFKSCDYVEDGGESGRAKGYYGCRISKKSKYLVYADESVCNAELDIMKIYSEQAAENARKNPALPSLSDYGFEWGNRDNLKNVKCVPMTERLLEQFKSSGSWCDEIEKGGYSGKTETYYRCGIGNMSKYLVYASEDVCMLELSVMQTFTKQSAGNIASPVLSWYGFNPRPIKNAQCIPMTPELLARFKPCKYYGATAGRRAGDPERYRCAVNKKIEYRVFPYKEACEYERSGMLERFLLQ